MVLGLGESRARHEYDAWGFAKNNYKVMFNRY